MEDLIQLVSDCLARHGLLPAGDPQPGESTPKLTAKPLPEALPEHNYRSHNYGKGAPPDPSSLRRAETAGRGTAAL
jgi:hypothetical protein